jgi:hypothetical protein
MMNTHGKIASLPAAVREELNRRLADGQTGPAVLAWLNQIPEVQAVLALRFHGRPIIKQNLTAWRRQELPRWLDRRDGIALVADFSNKAARLARAGSATIAEGAAALASAQLFQALQAAPDPLDPAAFAALVRDLAILRRIDLATLKLRLELQNLARKDREIRLHERRVRVLESRAGIDRPSRSAFHSLSPEDQAILSNPAAYVRSLFTRVAPPQSASVKPSPPHEPPPSSTPCTAS